jgi:hypothetical protein
LGLTFLISGLLSRILEILFPKSSPVPEIPGTYSKKLFQSRKESDGYRYNASSGAKRDK